LKPWNGYVATIIIIIITSIIIIIIVIVIVIVSGIFWEALGGP